jgi:hypothetical protein
MMPAGVDKGRRVAERKGYRNGTARHGIVVKSVGKKAWLVRFDGIAETEVKKSTHLQLLAGR